MSWHAATRPMARRQQGGSALALSGGIERDRDVLTSSECTGTVVYRRSAAIAWSPDFAVGRRDRSAGEVFIVTREGPGPNRAQIAPGPGRGVRSRC
jgi:hypothetical protein